MNRVLARWNSCSASEAVEEALSCCGSSAWAKALVGRRPFVDEDSIITVSDDIWNYLGPKDWMEAFAKHPRIGERLAPAAASKQSGAWSSQEQSGVAEAEEAVRQALAGANLEYEEKFGRVFIVCATGKSAQEMLDILRSRVCNDDATEFRVAAEEQRKITNLRLKKWLSQ